MHSIQVVGSSDGDAAELAAIVHEVETADAVIAAAQGRRARALARATELAEKQAAGASARVQERDMALRGIAAELAGACRTSDRAMQRQISDAWTLVRSFPATLAAWEANRITRAHVHAVTSIGVELPLDARPGFDVEAANVCEADTAGRVKSRLRILADRMHPRTFTERHQDAREGRCVRIVDIGDGMSDLIATLPTLHAAAISDRLTAMGRAVKDARAASDDPVIGSDTRTMDQIRADVLTDMLLTAAPDADPTRDDDGVGTLGAIRARVQVVVPALTLLGREDGPVDLIGQAPIDADTARILAAASTVPLERILTHPVTGSVIEVDTYQRPAALDRWLRARDQHCRFPGCRIPAERCDVDHTHDAAHGGPTARSNLAHLCTRHHSMKQFTAWKVRQLADGVLEWTSPLGRVYTDEPDPPLTFTTAFVATDAPAGAPF